MIDRDLERRLVKNRYYIHHPLRDPWNWIIVIGVIVVCALPLLVAVVMQ